MTDQERTEIIRVMKNLTCIRNRALAYGGCFYNSITSVVNNLADLIDSPEYRSAERPNKHSKTCPTKGAVSLNTRPWRP